MVKFITFKNKKHPIRISYYALKKMAAELKVDLTQIDTDKFSFEQIEALLYYGLESGAKADASEFSFTREQMEDVLDECFTEFIVMIPEFFAKKEDITEKKDMSQG